MTRPLTSGDIYKVVECVKYMNKFYVVFSDNNSRPYTYPIDINHIINNNSEYCEIHTHI